MGQSLVREDRFVIRINLRLLENLPNADRILLYNMLNFLPHLVFAEAFILMNNPSCLLLLGVLPLHDKVIVTNHLVDRIDIIKGHQKLLLDVRPHIFALSFKLLEVRRQFRVIGKQVQLLLEKVHLFIVFKLLIEESLLVLDAVVDFQLPVLALEFLYVLPEHEVVLP